MLYCTMTYLANDAWTNVELTSLFQCEIGEKSITGISFWQTEGGTAKISCLLTPELRYVISQNTERYFDAEFLIYESDTIQKPVFRGYLKRGEFSLEPIEPDDPLSDSIIEMTLHNALKVLIESRNDEKIYGTYTLPSSEPIPIDLFLASTLQAMFGLLRNRKPTLAQTGSRPLYTEPTVVNAHDPALATPVNVSERLLWKESDYPHFTSNPTENDLLYCVINTRQIYLEVVSDTITYLHYYRNFATLQPIGGQRYRFKQSVAKYQWKISGAGIYTIPGNNYLPVEVNANIYGTDYSNYDLSTQYPELETETAIVSQTIAIGNDRYITIEPYDNLTIPNISLLYTGRYYFDIIDVNPNTKIFDAIVGMLRVNMASLNQVGDIVYIDNKLKDSYSFTVFDNPIFEGVQITSNEFANDVVKESDLPFVNSESIATQLNEYFNSIIEFELPFTFTLEIDLNSLQDEITNTIEPGQAIQLGAYRVFITNVFINYEDRTAQIKGMGRLA